MQDPLYANDEAISSRKYRNPSLCPKNRLHLLPEHLAQISTAFIQQLSLAPLTSRELRILSTIYYQTIGHNKREDDMNGKCLELLTGIRSDHANEAVRRMDALDIVITRQGAYGKWMSINFDFKNWGKKVPKTKTNNPTVLLSDAYKIPLHNPADTPVFCLHVLADQSSATRNEPIAVTLPAATEAPVPATSVTKTSPAISPAKPVRSAPSVKSFNIHYPDSLPKPLCKKMATVLNEIGVQQQAQRLVDYFATRLQTGLIREPIAYFSNLKNRLLLGQLDLSDTSSGDNTSAFAKTASKKANQTDLQLPILQEEYTLATGDYSAVKNTIEGVSRRKALSFDEAAASIHYRKIWKNVVKRVENITKELAVYQQKNAKQPLSSVSKKKENQIKRTARKIPQHINDLLAGLELLSEAN